MFQRLEGVEKRYEELNGLISDPNVISNQNEWKKLMKEHSDIEDIVIKFREYKKVQQSMEDAKEMLNDPELKELAAMEFEEAKEALPKIEEELKILLIPKDPNDDKNVICEIRGGAGGEESSLFAGDLFGDNLFYDIQGMEYEDILETAQQFRIRHASELNIGDPFYMQEGDEFYETSSLTGRKGTIGQGIRQAGNYAVTGVSIYCNGQYYGSFVDLEASKAGYNLGTFINETAAKYGLNHENLELRLHLGNSSNYTVAGWTDISSLLQEDEITPEVIGKKAVEGSTYDGEIKDFKGTTITINTLDGKVEIPVMDASGNLYEAGTTVYGSDGKEYIISGLEIVEDDVMVSDTISQTVYREEQVAVGKKLTWRIQDCNLTVAIAPLLGAIASHIATKKKNEEELNPCRCHLKSVLYFLHFNNVF